MTFEELSRRKIWLRRRGGYVWGGCEVLCKVGKGEEGVEE